MTIPFIGVLKKATACFGRKSEAPGVEAKSLCAQVAKPSSERLSKTVMPNSVRQSSPGDSLGADTSMSGITIQVPRGPKLPPSVALALQPKVERTVSLQLQDILGQLPAGYIKPVEQFDPAQRVLLKASEVERGMASGKPTVALATIFQQVPDIFLRTVKPDDTTEVGLPFEKVLEQFQKVHVRNDQEAENFVPQVDTPILQAALEDTEKFGTPMVPVQMSHEPPMRVQPATAHALSSAEPESTIRETIAPATRKGIQLSSAPPPVAAPPVSSTPAGTPTPPAAPTSPTRIPFHLPPNGTGGSAAERVPASRGPSVPPPASKPMPPPRAPLKVSPPNEELKPKFTLVPGTAKPEESEQAATEASAPAPTAAAASADERKISLSLRAVLQSMPVFQLKGSPNDVAEDARIELSLSLVESQLPQGRVAIPAKTFRDALPEQHRDLFNMDEAESPVLLPLQEVLTNLPGSVLKMRDDQEVGDEAAAFETPFSIKAAEDAQRLNASTAAPAPATTVAAPSDETKKEEEKKPEEVTVKADAANVAPAKADKISDEPKPAKDPAAAAPPLALKLAVPSARGKSKAAPPSPGIKVKAREKTEQSKPAPVEANTNAKDVVARASALPGVAACSITFEDGLGLAGNLPDDVQVGGLCAMAPSLLQKMNRHTAETKLGPLQSMTLHCRESQMSFFMQGNICLTVLHANGDLTPATNEGLTTMAKELSHTYSQPETVHVDH